jgi:hypothetical protein
MNKVHPYRELEREHITSGVSLRELCRRHGIRSHSPVVDQAKKRKWQEKREQYQAKESEAFMSRHAARMADRQAELHDKAIDVIDEALDKFRSDMRAMKLVRQPDGSTAEEPAWRMTPKDIAVLLDRLMVLFERTSAIIEHRGLTVTSEMSVDTLREFIEATPGRARPSPMEESPLPRARRLDDRRADGNSASSSITTSLKPSIRTLAERPWNRPLGTEAQKGNLAADSAPIRCDHAPTRRSRRTGGRRGDDMRTDGCRARHPGTTGRPTGVRQHR